MGKEKKTKKEKKALGEVRWPSSHLTWNKKEKRGLGEVRWSSSHLTWTETLPPS